MQKRVSKNYFGYPFFNIEFVKKIIIVIEKWLLILMKISDTHETRWFLINKSIYIINRRQNIDTSYCTYHIFTIYNELESKSKGWNLSSVLIIYYVADLNDRYS